MSCRNVRVVSSSSPHPLEARLERLERALATISAEVASIRAELNAEPPATQSPPTPASAERATDPPRAQPRPERRVRETAASLDFERLLGRYGMLGIAVIAAVAAVGTFLSWAIRSGYLHLDPPARVIIGLAAAAALGAWGLKLRVRERSFGSSILGLALVIVQVCAYAAGPGFHLVPTLAAFTGAAFVSWMLAIFAHSENDEPLWCVGFGGAALAPFVTSDGDGNEYGLLAYGLLVLIPACLAISHRVWPVAWRVFYLVTGVYALSGLAMAQGQGTARYLAAFAFPFAIAFAGVVPFAPDERKRAALRWLGILGAIAALSAPSPVAANGPMIAASIGAALLLWLFVIDQQAFTPQSSLLEPMRQHAPVLDWIDVAALPLVFAFSADDALRLTPFVAGTRAAAAVLFTIFAWRRDVSASRDAGAFAAVTMAVAAVFVLDLEAPLGRLSAFVGIGALALLAFRMKPSLSWLLAAIAIFVTSMVASVGWLMDRRAYTFTPFMTESSATAVVVLVALICVSRFWPSLRSATRVAMGDRPESSYVSYAKLLVRGVTLAPWVWAFIWVAIELSMAYSASTSTLLLVAYFAACGVGCVGVGRWRRAPKLRQTGLVLALVAAATAFYGATSYFDFGARILAYLVTSAFLLGIAYWYRRPGGLEPAT